MAEKHGSAGHPDMDYPEHERTYAMFITLSKWTTIAAATILVLMALILI